MGNEERSHFESFIGGNRPLLEGIQHFSLQALDPPAVIGRLTVAGRSDKKTGLVWPGSVRVLGGVTTDAHP
jgi:hypothetical protein